jgi:RimJ/RimL family protein N-acetyltransferase
MNTIEDQITLKILKNVPIDSRSGITLVPFDGSEVGLYEKWFSDPDVLRYLHPNTPFTTDSQVRVPVPEFVNYVVESNTDAYFRIEHPEFGSLGHSSMTGIDLNSMSFRRGCVIGEKQHWGKGIGTFVGKMLLAHAENLGFQLVRAGTNANNVASLKNLRRHMDQDGMTPTSALFKKELNDIPDFMRRIGMQAGPYVQPGM